ncbi:carbohydrate esterase family 5 protein [Cadophora sp. DSE1049]|nr:carbohydrate esterase family 5 protein [Cadophora sp. DSE1049]
MLLSFWTLLALFGLTLASPVPAPAPIANPAPAPIANPNPSDLIARETDLNAFLSLLLDHLPAIDGTLTAISGILTTFQGFLALVSGKKTTYNQLTSSCKPYTVVFARGTVEPGNVGILVGPPFFDALRAKVGSAALAVQGVNDYKASIAGYLAGGDGKGSVNMATQIATAFKTCPNTKLVVSGYSQGGQLVHNALASLPAATAAWVSKVVIFGDPNNGTAIPNVAASKVITFCHKGDNICVDGLRVLQQHLTYGLDARNAAIFVVS